MSQFMRNIVEEGQLMPAVEEWSIDDISFLL
jgi:hypothetical protein